ncbi:polyprenol phosphomannose-dependent alpha 1,6 mannosyltransferase MptB [Tomitella biformata]|uniref:polyprenol phosphomannose-dependent alpha 1,6 mannosyltransferase MptB n=1 Tax=Tomitella biformata TaxID=630403 RepID=UPI0004633B78|nr:polyprenol phosphomannose-dependent alpha 1,6 mannosyltransferase MptB [Tomitella biformata]
MEGGLHDAGAGVAALHTREPDAPPLNAVETGRLRAVRRVGATGAVMMAIGALGAGAQPVMQNPVYGQRVLGLMARMPSVALTVAFTGTVLLVLAWLLLGRLAVGSLRRGNTPRQLSRSQMDRTLFLWMAPLLVAPPMYSKDVYSYLAQSEIAARGMDPYKLGPAQALGVDNILTRTVPNIWRETPAPYEPLFLWLGKLIGSVTGNNIVAGILAHRLLEVLGVALMIWAVPRLARRCGVAPVAALWLGVANPLVYLHLIAGVHNEALMIGLMVAGVELCMRAIEGTERLTRGRWALFYFGAFVIVLSSAIKIPTLLALGFVGLALARRLGPQFRHVFTVAAALSALTIFGLAFLAWSTGLGFGWLHTLNTASEVRSWMSLPTLLGIGTGGVGILLGLGDHTAAILSITQPLALVVVGIATARMLIATYTGRVHPVGALGVSLAVLVLLFPVVQPWYLLWALVPLAAWATKPMFRVPAVAISAFVCIVGPMPNGGEYPPLVIVQAAVAVIGTLCVIVFFTRKRIPWLRDTDPDEPPAEPPGVAEATVAETVGRRAPGDTYAGEP